MSLISLNIEQARQTASTFDRSSNDLDNLRAHLQQQWSSLSSTWEGHSKHETEAEVHTLLNRGGQVAQLTRERGVKLTQIADRFQAADENEPIAVTRMPLDRHDMESSPHQEPVDSQKYRDLFGEYWNGMTLEQREQFLKDYMSKICAQYGIPIPNIEFIDTQGPAKYNEDSGTVYVPLSYVNSGDFDIPLKSIAHETRHAMQYYFIDHPDQAPPSITKDQIASWKDGFDHYNENDPSTQMTNPVEKDALDFMVKNDEQYFRSKEGYENLKSYMEGGDSVIIA